jgi:protein-disulfide isomerase
MGKAASARDPRDVSFKLDEGQYVGDKAARVAVVEFSDFQCPYCGRFARETWPQIRNEYINTGKIRYGFRDFPMVSIHPNAMRAAAAAECAAEQGKYWEMHDRLFANPDSLSDSDLARHAAELGLEATTFKGRMDNGKNQEKIQKGMGEALKAGGGGTPTFFIGTVDSEGTFKPATVITGAQTFAIFKQALDTALASLK